MPSGIYQRSTEHKNKVRERMKGNSYGVGRIVTKKVRRGIGLKKRGVEISEEQKRLISFAMKGIKRSEKTRKRMSERQKGEKSHFWKGGVSKNKEHKRIIHRKWAKENRSRLNYLNN